MEELNEEIKERDILCQKCPAKLKEVTKNEAFLEGWTVIDDPYMPHWLCPSH